MQRFLHKACDKSKDINHREKVTTYSSLKGKFTQNEIVIYSLSCRSKLYAYK